MSIDTRLKANTAIFGGWQLDDVPIAPGSNGTVVYRMKRGNADWTEYCAVKAIPLAEEYGTLESRSTEEQAAYGRGLFERTQKAKSEIITMEELRGNTHIVDYLDYAFRDWSDEWGFGRDLYIRMELLNSLRSDIRRGRVFTEQEVIQIGCDICRALILCHRKGIIHRDIKPDNIFYNKDGNYKLGDFGISKSLPDIANGYAGTGVGTFAYMPAEQLKGKYTKLVDIYSLGLVLYELSNGNRLPFAAGTYATDQDVLQRLSGQALPAPQNAGAALRKVILKACAFDPGARYASAEEFLTALENISRVSSDLEKPPPGLRLRIVIGIAAAVVLLLALGRFFRNDPGEVPPSEPVLTGHTEAAAETAQPPEIQLLDLEPGSIITLGQYEQDGNTLNGLEPIQWLVLTTEESEALVVSVLGLDTFPYDSLQEETVWENSSIRTWLSDTFYENAFTVEEKQVIAEKTILQHTNTGYPYCNQGHSTTDSVFLLSTEEYISYLYNNEEIDPEYRQGIPSDYVVDKGVNVYDYHKGARSWWWLRTSSNYNDKACFVSAMGSKDVYVGYPINTSGGMIRPAMWIRVGSAQPESAAYQDPIATDAAVSDRPVHMLSEPKDLTNVEQKKMSQEPVWGQWAHKREDVTVVVFEDSIRSVTGESWDLSAAKDQSILAWMDGGTLHIASEGVIVFPENVAWLFAGFTNMRSLDFGTNVDTSKVVDMSHMFSSCKRLTELDLTMFDTSNVENMDCLFYSCSGLEQLDLTSFDTSNVTDMGKLFAYCSSLPRIDVSSFDTSRVRDMSFMFYWCESLTQLDLTGFNTPRLENMNSMFYHCEKLEQLDLRSFDTSNVYSMNYVFSGCENLESLDLSSFDVSQKPTHKDFMDDGKLIGGKPWYEFFR